MFEEYKNALEKYAAFVGRASRKDLWMFVLYNFIISIAVGIVAGIIRVPAVSWLYALFVFIPNLALAARRLHDTGRSGWWQLIALVPIIGFVVLIIFYCTDSQPGENKYGPNPKQVMPQ